MISKLQTSGSKIPKTIHQTWINQDGKNIKESIDTCKLVNKGYIHKFYTDDDQLEYIEKHFSKFITDQYKKIQNGSCRSDFFRYCVLFIEGGVYIDIDCKPIRDLNDIITHDTDLLYTKSALAMHTRVNNPHVDVLYNGVLGAAPRLTLFNKCIHNICDYIYRGELNTNPACNIHFLTGTHMLNHHIKAYQEYVGKLNEQVLTMTEHNNKPNKHIIIYKGIPVIHAQHYRLDRSTTPHYGKQKFLYKPNKKI